MPKTTDKRMIKVPADFSSESSNRFYAEIGQALSGGIATLNLDCSDLDHVTSSHINYLWKAYESCLKAGTTLKLENTSEGLIRILKVLDLSEFFLVLRPKDDNSREETTVRTQAINIACQYEDRFQANAPSIKKAMDKFGETLKKMNLTDVIHYEICTIFYETATNIQSHARLGEAGEIDFSASIFDDRIVMQFSDQGVPFDPTSCETTFDPQKTAKLRIRNGFGLNMIRKLSNSLSYSRKRGGINVLTLEKRWSLQG